MPQLLTVKRVYKETDGAEPLEAVTLAYPAEGGRIRVAAVTDFDEEGGTAVLVSNEDPEEFEVIEYGGIEEGADDGYLTDIARTGTKKAFSVGEFYVQEGTEATVSKYVDGFLDDEAVEAVGIPVPAYIYGLLRIGERTQGLAETIWVDEDSNGELQVVDGPIGAVPVFEDTDVFPPSMTDPDEVDNLPPGTKTPDATAITALVHRPLQLPDGTTLHFIDTTWTEQTTYTDGSPIVGRTYLLEFEFDGVVKFQRTVPDALTYTQLVDEVGEWTVRVFVRDIAGKLSEPAEDTVSTEPDDTPPAKPSTPLATGAANGGGNGLTYWRIDPATEPDFSHFEVHASTVEGFTPSAATKVLESSSNVFAVYRAHNGSTITTFGYSTPVKVRVYAVDNSGNKSVVSDQGSGSAALIQSADVTDLNSTGFVSGSTGWAIYKSGNAEFNNVTIRGAAVASSVFAGVIVSTGTGMSVQGSNPGSGIVIDGGYSSGTGRIIVGTGLVLMGAGSGVISFGTGAGACVIYGTGAGGISVGTDIDLLGGGGGQITVGGITLTGATSTVEGGTARFSTFQTAVAGATRLEITVGNPAVNFWNGSTNMGAVQGSASGISIVMSSGYGITLQTANQDITLSAGGGGNDVNVSGRLDMLSNNIVNVGSLSASSLTVTTGDIILSSGKLEAAQQVRGSRLITGTSNVTPESGHVALYKDGNDLKAKDPSGTVRTLCTF